MLSLVNIENLNSKKPRFDYSQYSAAKSIMKRL